MNDPIVSIDQIAKDARRAVQPDHNLDANPYPDDSAAARMWEAQFRWFRGMKGVNKDERRAA